MPIDIPPQTIALDVNGAQPQANAGPLGPLGTIAPVIGQLQQNQLVRNQLAARARAGQIIAQSPDLASGLDAASRDPLVAGYGMEALASAREAMLAQTQQAGALQGQAEDATGRLLTAMPSVITNPASFDLMSKAVLANVNPQARGMASEAIANIRRSLTEGLPEDPLAASAELRKRAIGLATSVGQGPELLSNIVGRPATLDTGGQVVTGLQAPAAAGGGFVPSGAFGKSLAPQVVSGQTPQGGQYTGTVGPGGGAVNPLSIGPSAQDANYLQHRGADMAAYQQGLDERTATGSHVMQTVAEAQKAQKLISTGGGATLRTQLGTLAQFFGADDALVDKVANGDLSASQELQKLMVNTTMGQIRDQIPAGSRLSQMEFDAFNKNNPNLETDPRAIGKIFNFWTRVYNRDATEQSELNDFLAKGGNISSWPAHWQKRMQELGVIDTGGAGVATGAKATRKFNPLTGGFDQVAPQGAGAAP